jgi:hypothetical protein
MGTAALGSRGEQPARIAFSITRRRSDSTWTDDTRGQTAGTPTPRGGGGALGGLRRACCPLSKT